MRPLAKSQLDECSYARNDNAVVFAQPDLNGSGRKDPRVGCAGIVRRGNEVLLGRRNKEPNRGLWVLPGGGVDFGETFAETLTRELSEETGIEIDVDGVFNVYELINPPHEHRVIVYMYARYRAGQPLASSDLSDVRFFRVEELKQMSAAKMISPFVESVLRKAELI
jgi:ADP-ribose pyrophosphatase YjhB (NUDIX family)